MTDEEPVGGDEPPESETATGEGPQEAESLADTEADLKDVFGSDESHGGDRLNLSDEPPKRRS